MDENGKVQEQSEWCFPFFLFRVSGLDATSERESKFLNALVGCGLRRRMVVIEMLLKWY